MMNEAARSRLCKNQRLQQKVHAGVIVSDQIQVGLIVRRILKLLDAKSAADMQNWLEFLSSWR